MLQVLYIAQGTFLWERGIAILSVTNASLWLHCRGSLFGASSQISHIMNIYNFLFWSKNRECGFLWLKRIIIYCRNKFLSRAVCPWFNKPLLKAQKYFLMADELCKNIPNMGKNLEVATMCKYRCISLHFLLCRWIFFPSAPGMNP